VDDAAATYEFAAVQTYDDGEVVAWDQTGDGDTEPERPAPTLSLDGSDASADETAEHALQETSSSSDPTARVLGGAGLALGVAGLGLALSGRGRRQDAS
jgi:hypothetical protein